MDLEEAEQWLNCSSSSAGDEIPKGISSENLQSYPSFDPSPNPKWDCPMILDYEIGIDPPTIPIPIPASEWDPKAMLSSLGFLEQKIHQLQSLVHVIAGGETPRQRQVVAAEVASVIAQLISAAGSLLPAGKPEPEPELKEEEEHEHEAEEGESLTPGTYEILQLEKEEILAPHTHFCAVCGKGFKRDANLRMHMRGHGDEYKTAAALAKPSGAGPGPGQEPGTTKRYSCPFGGCKRNREHKKFQPLKTILCVKNHYKRTHCDKSFTCSRCKAKKFSVIADLKTHEKHCGRDKWLCSCGTTFSRKDKLFGHISLFQGHTPAIPFDSREKGSSSSSLAFASASPVRDSLGEDQTAFFSPMNFDASSFGGFHEFPRPPYEDSESSFSLLLSGSCNYPEKTLGDSPANNFV